MAHRSATRPHRGAARPHRGATWRTEVPPTCVLARRCEPVRGCTEFATPNSAAQDSVPPAPGVDARGPFIAVRRPFIDVRGQNVDLRRHLIDARRPRIDVRRHLIDARRHLIDLRRQLSDLCDGLRDGGRPRITPHPNTLPPRSPQIGPRSHDLVYLPHTIASPPPRVTAGSETVRWGRFPTGRWLRIALGAGSDTLAGPQVHESAGLAGRTTQKNSSCDGGSSTFVRSFPTKRRILSYCLSVMVMVRTSPS